MHRWKLSALAAAAFVSVALAPTDAAALALGSLRVQSSLGENLRAEIEIPQITAAEMNSLSVQIAAPEVFRAQGMDYSSAARSVQISVQRNPDGTASLRLSSNTPIQEPFVDLVIQSQWSTGNLVRTYTLLLDPPASQRRAAPAQVTPPVVAAPAAAPSPVGRPRATAPSPAAAAPAAAAPRNDSLRVQAGDTAGRLANANRPSGVSLDQMLVAMLRSNPKAFINGNVNRIRAGAVVQLPSREQALETSASEARQIVAAQSRDFNTYRRSLASKAPQATVQAADRSSGGKVQAHVEDASAAAATPDKLTLSKGAVQSAAAEEKMANQKQADDQNSRLNELQRNLAELNELAQNSSAAKPAAPAAAAAPAAVEPASATATPGVEVAASNPAVTAAAAPEAATTSGDKAPEATPPAASDAPAPQATPQPAPKPAPKPAVVPAAPVAEASLADELLDNPLVPAGGAAMALLLGLLGYTAWKRRRAQSKPEDPTLGDSQLQPDSFFGSSGGQQVDTSSAEGSATTMAYSPSQLDGGGDVDPVAEADVYLAYGRDVQAEEILKEALRNQPERLSIHLKLAEICVKRHDIKALENTARGMQPVSQPQDPEWQRVVEMGRSLDPTNTFFAGADTGASTTGNKPASSFAAALNAAKPELATPMAGAVAAAAAASTPDLADLDINLDLPEGLITANAPAVADIPAAQPPSDDDFAALELPSALDSQLDVTAPPAVEDPPTLVQDTVIGEDSSQGLSGLDLDLSGFDVPAPAAPTPPAAAEDVEVDLGAGLDFDLNSPAPEAAAGAAAEPAPAVPQDLEFDLGSLDLDLGTDATPAAESQAVHNAADDPLSTKLDLAQEFNSIGDSEGARALIEEVLAEASGPLKARAQKMLSELD